MKNKKNHILITGGSGLLALNWAITMRDIFQVTLGFHDRRIDLDNVETSVLNLNSIPDLRREVSGINPDIIIHTAGLTTVEGCEANPIMAKEVNVDLAANVAVISCQLGIQLAHISTDHLFDGQVPNVSEEEATNPMNVYGQTKAAAEQQVLANNPQALVVRTNFYGWGPSYRPSFSDMIIYNLRRGLNITLFDDVFYTPIFAQKLIETTHELLAENASGVFHVVGDQRISKYEFGLKLAEQFNLNANLIIPKSIKSKHNLVKRPLDMSLSNAKVCKFLGRTLGSTGQQIEGLKTQEKLNLAKEIIRL